MSKIHKNDIKNIKDNISDIINDNDDIIDTNGVDALDWLNNMSNKKYPWYEETYYFFCRIISRIEDICYEIKYGFQRMFRGYDDVETFETFSTFLKRYTKILKELRKWKKSYSNEFNTYEEWDAVLGEMINHFELSNEFHDSYKNIDFKDAEKNACDHAEKALEMFVKYFWDLWD